ncbi:MAG: PAS domain S-box protein, partial [bacterium]
EAHKDLEKKVQERTLELEKTNAALQRVSAYSRSLLESNLDALVTINDEGKITDVNRATEAVTGLPRDELIGSDFADYFTDPDMAKAGYQQVFSQGEVRDYELTLRHRNGNLMPVFYNASLYRDESGKILGVFAAARDITERKTSEWALKESEQRYRTLFTRSNIGISLLSRNGKLVEINEYFARVHGYSVPEMLSINLNDYILNTPASLQRSDERIRRIFAGEVLYFETEHYHKDGHVFPLEVSASLVSVGGESLMHCLHLDITERKRAEDVLRKSEARFKSLLQDVQAVAVQGYAPDGTTQYWNQASEQFYGYTAEEAIGRNLLDLLIPPEMRGDVEQAIRQMAETGQPIPAAELSLMRKNGSRLAVYSSHTIVQIPGQTQELFCIDIDMTDRKQAEQDRVAREVAEKANQAKSLFVANMSHEIRTPMNAVMGFAQVLLRDPTLTPQQAEHVRTIHRSGDHLLRLINDILDMSKIEAGRTTLNEAVFCMHDLLDDMTMMFRTRADSQGLQLLMECDENVPRNVTTDEGKLRQVLVNLLGNAVKFTTTGGIAVRVRAKAVEGKTGGEKESLRLEVEVEDTGPGIPDEDIGQIFDPFQQGGAGVKSGGTGLGLAISRRFVEMMGGELTVKSQVGTGSCFRFDLLLKPAAEVVKREKRASRRIIGLEPGTGPVRILAVDDTPNNRAMLCALLRPLGFEVAEAGNGVEALEVFAKWSPHAVLMDMRMPVMDGYEATRQLKATSKTPVIAITASAFEDTKEQVMATGVDAYIRKPFRMEEICEVLGKYLGLRYAFAGETTPAPDHLEAKPLTGESLAALPQDMIAAMQQAVAEGNIAHLTELIASVEKLDSSTAHALQALADQYEYEKLNQLLEKGGMNND